MTANALIDELKKYGVTFGLHYGGRLRACGSGLCPIAELCRLRRGLGEEGHGLCSSQVHLYGPELGMNREERLLMVTAADTDPSCLSCYWDGVIPKLRKRLEEELR